MSQLALSRLKERFGDAVLSTHQHRGDDTAVVDRAVVVEVLRFLRDDPDLRLDMPIDLTCVDYLEYPGHEGARFEIVYHLRSTTLHQRLRVKCRVTEQDPTIATSVDVYSGFNWFEREAYDMYGIRFVGHPDLRRMFMYDEFVGHPLRKDYPKERRQPLIRREE